MWLALVSPGGPRVGDSHATRGIWGCRGSCEWGGGQKMQGMGHGEGRERRRGEEPSPAPCLGSRKATDFWQGWLRHPVWRLR